ncbi:MAG: hypothetical protein INR71_10180 [Terriglobus roseus]|nr:hypothetical protein [Terriglobus roseus]
MFPCHEVGDETRPSSLTSCDRIAYIVAFTLSTNQAISGVRTLIWGGSVYSSLHLLISSARLLGQKGL